MKIFFCVNDKDDFNGNSTQKKRTKSNEAFFRIKNSINVLQFSAQFAQDILIGIRLHNLKKKVFFLINT